MKGEHRPGYKRPRTGEKRATRQPLGIDKLEEKVRIEIQKRRAAGETWGEIESASSQFAGERLPANSLARWYDLRVAQVQREVLEQAERARALAATFAQKGFVELPEATLNALSAEVFAVAGSGSPAERGKALGNLLFLVTKLMAARAKEKAVNIQERGLKLAEKKFEDLKGKADKETSEAAAKLGKGREITVADINRIRERVFGLAPIVERAAAGHPA
jgi:hypothetical protein